MNVTNATIGLGNLTDSNSTGMGLNETMGYFGETIPTGALGSASFAGIFILAIFAIALWRADASLDTSATIMVPTMFFLGSYGFMPYGEGIIFGLVLAIAGIFSFGIIKFAFR